jgi:hypothetical protein
LVRKPDVSIAKAEALKYEAKAVFNKNVGYLPVAGKPANTVACSQPLHIKSPIHKNALRKQRPGMPGT